jgi:DNA-binding HxlR family transcriptional regulator
LKVVHGESCEEVWCPVEATLALLNRRWTLHIIRAMLEGHQHFNEIGRVIGINPRTLSERLKQLECEGILERRTTAEHPQRVDYLLTQKGLALNCIVESLATWGKTWMKQPEP